MKFQVINEADPLNDQHCGKCQHVMAGPIQDACMLFGVRLQYRPVDIGRYENERANKCIEAEKAQQKDT